MIEASASEFDALVSRALDELPESFAALLDNIVVTVEAEPSKEDFESVGLDPERDDLLGLYEGVPMEERGSGYSALPDRVVIFRLPILWMCRTEQEVVREVRDTVVHELGHYFGLSDEDMPY